MELSRMRMSSTTSTGRCCLSCGPVASAAAPSRKQLANPRTRGTALRLPGNRGLAVVGFLSGRALERKVSNGSRWSAGVWLDNSAQVETQVPLEEAWELWEDREGVTRWMPWISSVQVQQDKPELSKWTLKWEALGQNLEFSWMARNMQPIPLQKIHWRSVDGLPNRGAVRFFPRSPSACAVQLTISYEVPDQLSGLASALRPLVENILKADLERFATFAKSNKLDQQRRQPKTETAG